MNVKLYVKMLDVCCWVARRKSQVGGGLASNYNTLHKSCILVYVA